jgi:cobaltochelatase CobS
MTTIAKVTCQLCDYASHVLVTHIETKHNLTTYLRKYPNAPLWSALGEAEIRAQLPDAQQAARTRKLVPLANVLPNVAPDAITTGTIAVFEQPGKMTPTLDPRYVFPLEALIDTLAVLEKPQRNRVYVQGYSGTGKTQFVHNLAALCNAELYEWNADAYQQRSTLVGQWTVKNGATVWQDGILPVAMRAGAWLLINELDTIDPATLNIIKPVLEDPARLVLLENGGEVVKAHPDFRVIATANTWSRGDDSGLFVNTQTQSDADVRRWNARIQINYLTLDRECTMLKGYFPKMSTDLILQYADVATKIRKAFAEGRTDKTFSPAELINWMENVEATNKSPLYCADISFLNSLAGHVAVTLRELVIAQFGTDNKGQGK